MIKKGVILSLILIATMLSAGCADTQTPDKNETKPPQTTAAETSADDTAATAEQTEAPASDFSEPEVKTITEKEAEEIALEKAGDKDTYIATYQQMVRHDDRDYYLINIRRKVDDGDGKFHYSHCGYMIVSMDGTDVKSADYYGETLYVYEDLN